MAGKFATERDERVWEASLSGCDDECGDVLFSAGWFGLVVFNDSERATLHIDNCAAAILNEDGQGFVTIDYYDTESEARDAWELVLEDVDDDEGMDA